jgi:hypothetical protein
MPDNDTISRKIQRSRQKKLDIRPFTERLKALLEAKNETMRKAALNAGLDHQAMRRVVDGGRPNMTSCILLGNYFEVNPNELLQLAGWPTLHTFDVQGISAENLLPEAVEVAVRLSRVASPGKRRKLARAFEAILDECSA